MKNRSTHQSFYVNNPNYSQYLEEQTAYVFSKYVDSILQYTSENDRILDVGCGTGQSLQMLREKGRQETCGIDISTSSIEMCTKKQLDCQLYDGTRFPFDDNSFDLVGSYNVLEHTDNPVHFLEEQLRVLKSGGHLLVVCPNFLSICNNYHPHTKGFTQKYKNIASMIRLSSLSPQHVAREGYFQKMTPVVRESPEPDDDAVNATNPLALLKFAKLNNLQRVYWSGKSRHKIGIRKIVKLFDLPLLRVVLGSSFFVFKK